MQCLLVNTALQRPLVRNAVNDWSIVTVPAAVHERDGASSTQHQTDSACCGSCTVWRILGSRRHEAAMIAATANTRCGLLANISAATVDEASARRVKVPLLTSNSNR